ncbi:hypothetical protein C7A12_24105 [Pseudomonas fluorescens]|uniref:Uncharacterized protein n=1 Tax=Pseudomonas fluorescens TaxID=294 RepID=A0A2T0IFH3_PSEFL|nr:hypothetical protein C7A12_24105 [Pseudomonas fluorescens]PRW74031.1 hypothetical protein C7A13_23710 [Pseudomonas fluorescens]PRW94080.1 hypothetical protein C7A10_04665 [Pseudomonas fluorescens]
MWGPTGLARSFLLGRGRIKRRLEYRIRLTNALLRGELSDKRHLNVAFSYLICPYSLFVGASLLAKNSQAPRSFREHALSLTFFASKLAPTEGPYRRHRMHKGHPKVAFVW